MYYRLNSNIALRSWVKVPYAYYSYGYREAKGLKQEEYELLSLCDGNHELPNSELLFRLLDQGLIARCEKGDTISEWQKPRFSTNRYFPAVNLAVTGKCNYNCKHCFMAKDSSAMTEEFTFEECVGLLDDFIKCGIQTITLTGGEPLLRHDFGELLEEIARRRLYLEDIGTNGSLITEELLDKLIALKLRPMIKISFDGIGHHDWMRGVDGAEERTIRAIKLCKSKGFYVKVQSCFHRDNMHSLYDTAMRMNSLSVDELRIIRTAESPRWKENCESANLTAQEYYDACLELLSKYKDAKASMVLDMWSFLTYYPQTNSYRFRPLECECEDQFKETFPVCRGNRGLIFIGCDGAVAPCNQLSGVLRNFGDDWGNVRREGLQQLLLDSEYLNRVTCTVGELFERNTTCGSCEYRKLCHGGCRAIGYGITGDYLGEDYMKCVFFKEGYIDKVNCVLA